MASFYFAIFFLSIFERTLSAGEISLKCTVEFCDEYVQKFPCPPLDPACSNPNVSLVIPSMTTCNCCEYCFLFQEEGEECVVGQPLQPLPKEICKPGTICDRGKCKKMTSPDPDFYKGYECENGKCYCAVIVDNKPKKIFGTFKEEDIKGEKQCQCSISAYEAKETINQFLAIPNAFVPTPRCLPNGQFDPLQCFDNLCGCVKTQTGQWDFSERRVPVSALGPNKPNCFDEKRHKIGQYYTTCEKERNELMSEKSWEGLGEIETLLSHTVQCTPDGEYAK